MNAKDRADTKKMVQEKINELRDVLKASGYAYNISGGISTSEEEYERNGLDMDIDLFAGKWVSSWC